MITVTHKDGTVTTHETMSEATNAVSEELAAFVSDGQWANICLSADGEDMGLITISQED